MCTVYDCLGLTARATLAAAARRHAKQQQRIEAEEKRMLRWQMGTDATSDGEEWTMKTAKEGHNVGDVNLFSLRLPSGGILLLRSKDMSGDAYWYDDGDGSIHSLSYLEKHGDGLNTISCQFISGCITYSVQQPGMETTQKLLMRTSMDKCRDSWEDRPHPDSHQPCLPFLSSRNPDPPGISGTATTRSNPVGWRA